jgi:hypothetical protein
LSDRPLSGLVLEAIFLALRGVTDLAEAAIPESFASRSFNILTYDSRSMHINTQPRNVDVNRLMRLLSHTIHDRRSRTRGLLGSSTVSGQT